MNHYSSYQRMISRREFKDTFLGHNRILAYCVLITFCSILSLPEEYKVEKSNVLNQWFVKIGWFWTNALILPLLFLTIKNDDKENVAQATLRILSSTFLWYTSVNLFQLIDTNTGFDISGHTFLLMFSNLIINSEIKYSRLNKSSLKGNSRETSTTLTVLGLDKNEPQPLFTVKVFLFILSALWDFMLLQTALYYHTILQKAIAALWAIGSWYILHLLFYHKPDAAVLGRGDRWTNEHISVNS